MLRGSVFASLVLALAALTAPAGAQTSYQFSLNYLGNNQADLAAGSTDPAGAMLSPGDSFVYEVLAQPGMAWRVNQTDDVFAMFALATNEEARRFGDVVLTLSLAGSTVLSYSEPGIDQSYVHIGTNEVTLTTGLMFDRFVISYGLTSAEEYVRDPDTGDYLPTGNPSATTLSTRSPIFGFPEFSDPATVSYAAAVPEPGPAALLVAGLLVVALRMGRRQPEVVSASCS